RHCHHPCGRSIFHAAHEGSTRRRQGTVGHPSEPARCSPACGGLTCPLTAIQRGVAMDKQTMIEAAVFRRLLEHLDSRKDVQNIDLMNLAGFCRNCLAKWYVAAAEERGVAIDYEEARRRIYGMPYDEWKRKYQKEASPEALAKFQASQAAQE